MPPVVVVGGHGQQVAIPRAGRSPINEEGLLDLRSVDGHWGQRVAATEGQAAGVLVAVLARQLAQGVPDATVAVDLVAERVEAGGAFGPPMSVWTHPGLMTMQVNPSSASSAASERLNMLSAALLSR